MGASNAFRAGLHGHPVDSDQVTVDDGEGQDGPVGLDAPANAMSALVTSNTANVFFTFDDTARNNVGHLIATGDRIELFGRKALSDVRFATASTATLHVTFFSL